MATSSLFDNTNAPSYCDRQDEGNTTNNGGNTITSNDSPLPELCPPKGVRMKSGETAIIQAGCPDGVLACCTNPTYKIHKHPSHGTLTILNAQTGEVALANSGDGAVADEFQLKLGCGDATFDRYITVSIAIENCKCQAGWIWHNGKCYETGKEGDPPREDQVLKGGIWLTKDKTGDGSACCPTETSVNCVCYPNAYQDGDVLPETTSNSMPATTVTASPTTTTTSTNTAGGCGCGCNDC